MHGSYTHGQRAYSCHSWAYTLPDGEISAEGVSIRPSLFEHPATNADALSGGTEKYAGVRGEVRFVARGNKVISTFHFID
jgi:hypothetical protein